MNTNKKNQTIDAFSDKWNTYSKICKDKDKLFKFEKNRYLQLYGFSSEKNLAKFLKNKKIILDAGCGIGYKAAWFAELAPESTVFGVDYSDSIKIAEKEYNNIKNLKFIQWDLSEILKCSTIISKKIDYISCDQVLHHTENPDSVLNQLTNLLSNKGEIALYVYRKKALPRELLDDFFRHQCKNMSHEEILSLSKKLTEIGKTLSELNIHIEVPDMPALDIKGGTYDLQRFIYYNFIKCYWNEEVGYDTSVITNYDWYRPSTAYRYSEKEFKNMIKENELKTISFYEDGSSYSGRFKKK